MHSVKGIEENVYTEKIAQNMMCGMQCIEYNTWKTLHGIQFIKFNAHNIIYAIQCIQLNAENTIQRL